LVTLTFLDDTDVILDSRDSSSSKRDK
jgi:hypothetical protein